MEASTAGSKRKRSPSVGTHTDASTRPRLNDEERIKIHVPHIVDNDAERRKERERQLALRLAESELNGAVEKPKQDPVAEMKKLALTRGGGTYIPPHRLKAMMAEAAAEDQAGADFQRMTWEALRKSINGLINKVNVANIKLIVPELFGENLIRGRGLFARSIMRAQASSLPYTPVFACLVAIVNSKLPSVGELVLHRLIVQFRRGFKRNDKPTCIATLTFIAHLCNQRVISEIIAMEILQLLLERPTDDSVELAVGFTREVGLLLSEEEPKFNNALYEMYRDILHSPKIEKRVQYMVEVLFQVRRDKFKDNPILPEGLDLVEEDDQMLHRISLTDQVAVQDTLNVFKFDPDYEQHEAEYKAIKDEILGSDDEESGSGSEDSDASEEEGGEDLTGTIDIHDQTETNLVNLRRRIYLTIMSALDFEEAVHKLLQIPLNPGQEVEMCNMIVECCSQERTFSKFYGLIGERLCKLNIVWSESFEQSFHQYFTTIHRYETNRLRNIARFFGHLLGTDALPWTVFQIVKLNEDDTTSSSRIFIKILFQELVGMLGMPTLKKRLEDPTMQMYYTQMFPLDNPKNTRFSINYWTSIQMGMLTEGMREHLKNMPAQIMAQQAIDDSSSSDVSSSSDSDSDSSSDVSSDSSDSRSRSPPRRRAASRSRSRTPPRRKAFSRSISPSPPRRRSRSRTPVRRRAVSRSRSRSRSPVRRRRVDSRSPSRSRSPPRYRRR